MKIIPYFGFLFLFLGLVFTLIGYSMLNDAGVTLKIFVAGPGIALMGLGMMIYPGFKGTMKQAKDKEFEFSNINKLVPTKAKIVWAILGLIGVFAALSFEQELAQFCSNLF